MNFKRGDKLFYDMGEGVKIRATYVEDDEGWSSVSFDGDGPYAIPVPVRPSRLSLRELTGDSA